MKYCKRCKTPALDSLTSCGQCKGPLSTFGNVPVAVPSPARPEPAPEVPPRRGQPAILVGGGLALVAALAAASFLLVGGLHRARDARESARQASGGEGREGTGAKLAVTFASFDDMGKLFQELGPGYRHAEIGEKDLGNPAALDRFDAVFLTCAEPDGADGDADSKRMARGLRDYVAKGGALYASDLRFDVVAAAFPDLVDRASVAQGLKQEIEAEVVSPELEGVLGQRAALHFTLDGWRPAAFRGPDVATLLQGKIRTSAGVEIVAPLAVRFTYGKGTVVFTSYHNEESSTDAERDLVRFLVRKTVLARSEAKAVGTMAVAGNVPRAVRSFDAVATSGRAEGTLPASGARALSFALVAPGGGVKGTLEVISPQQERTVKRGEMPLTIDIPSASPGVWRYVASVEAVPSPHYPASVVIGEPGRVGFAGNGNALALTKVKKGKVVFEEVSIGVETGSVPRRAPRIAVTEPEFDDVGKLLKNLGAGFRYATLGVDAIRTPGALDDYDIVFLTCNGWPTAWGTAKEGNVREGIGRGELSQANARRISETLRGFVERGGTLYASDLRYGMILVAFPGRSPGHLTNPRLLENVLDAERAWIKVKAPTIQVETASDALKQAGLTPALADRHEELVAGLEMSPLFEDPTFGLRGDLRPRVREALEAAKLPTGEADVGAIARTLLAWEKAIRDDFLGQPVAKNYAAKARVAAAAERLRQARASLKDDNPEGEGNQAVEAHVVDQGLRELFGSSTLPLKFNTRGWDPATFAGDDVTVLLRGEYTTIDGVRSEAPLLSRFREGQGTVIFTSFHNEAQNNEREEQLLRYLVFSAVTAKAEGIADKTMLSGGFSPAKRGQIAHSSGKDTLTRYYDSEDAGPLRFALTFAGSGARLRLTLVDPDGEKFSQEVDRTIVIQATGAPAGRWSYTVDSIDVPYANFPFSVSIGKAGPPGPASRPR